MPPIAISPTESPTWQRRSRLAVTPTPVEDDLRPARRDLPSDDLDLVRMTQTRVEASANKRPPSQHHHVHVACVGCLLTEV